MVFVLAQLLALLTAAFGTSFNMPPFPELVQDTPVIVRGHVGMVYADWGKGGDGSKRIYTFYEFKVDDVVKGSVPTPSVLLRQMGGQKDGVGLQISGRAEFSQGEDAVVFLTDKNDEGSYDVRNLMMGKFSLITDEATGREVLSGAVFQSHHEDTDGQSDPEPVKKWTIDDVKKLVMTQGASTTQAITIRKLPDSRPSPEVPTGTLETKLQSAPSLQLQSPEVEPSTRSVFSVEKILGFGIVILVLATCFVIWRRRI